MIKLLFPIIFLFFTNLSFATTKYFDAVNYIVENTPYPQKYHELMMDFTYKKYHDYFKTLSNSSKPFTEEENKEIKYISDLFYDKTKEICLLKNLECNYDWKITFIKGTQEAAFTSYYGHLIIDYSFLKPLPREEQLFVIFHELSHVLLRHSLEEFIIANEIFDLKKINEFDPDIIAYELNNKFILPTKLENLIEYQEFEADYLSLIFLRSMDIDIKKAANFVLKLENNRQTMLFHSNTKKRKENIILFLKDSDNL